MHSLAQKEKRLYLPKGIEEIAKYYSDTAKARDVFRAFFKSLSADITNKSTNIDEWELILEFTDKVIASQEELYQNSAGEMDLAVLSIQLQELKEDFDNRLHQVRGELPKESQTRAIVHTTRAQTLSIKELAEPTLEDLAKLEEELGDMPSDEELMAFMRQELEKE